MTDTYLASGSISTEPETWGWGTGSGGSATTGGCDYQYLLTPGSSFGTVGGASDNVSNDRAGVSYLGSSGGGAREFYDGRLVFVFDL